MTKESKIPTRPGIVGLFRQDRAKLLGLAGGAVLATLGFETVPLPVRAQFIPLASVLSALALPIVLFATPKFRRTSLVTAVAAFVLFAALHSVIALGIDLAVNGASRIRTVAWLRQLAALGAGGAVFFVLREALRRFSDRAVAVVVALGALPGVLLGVLNFIWGGLQVDAVGRVVCAARAAMLPPGLWVPRYFTDPHRAAGFCFEPSHFAIFLATVAVPVTLAWIALDKSRRLVPASILALELVSFLWAFSGVGIAVTGGMLLVLVVSGRFRRRALALLGLVCVTLVLFALILPDNYLAYQARRVISAAERHDLDTLPVSVTIPLFSTFGPFTRAFSSWNLLGYGLGGTSTHVGAILPAIALHDIRSGSWTGMPNLTTSVGRVFAETGLVGLALYAGLWVVALRILLRRGGPEAPPRYSPPMRLAAGLGLAGLAIAHAIKLGSFALPFLWFWLAYVDSRC